MTKEKTIEKQIVSYLLSIGAWCEALQSGSVMIKKGPYVNKMILCTPGTPDIIAFYDGVFYGIEVKKNEEQYKKWLKLEQRYLDGEQLPKSYEREFNQIKHKYKIIENGGIHLLTDSLADIKEYFNNI